MKNLVAVFVLSGMMTLPAAILANEGNEWEDLLVPAMADPSFINGVDKKVFKVPKVPEQHVDNQILRVEQEILILKAEVAYQYDDINALKNYISQLDKMVIFPNFQERVARLKQLSITAKITPEPERNAHLVVTGIQALPFSGGDKNAVTVILLPLTGDYAQAGNQLLESLMSALEDIDFLGFLVILDTALYDSISELWPLVKSYEPNFIFGPLRKSIATQWQSLNTGIPTLYFNEMPFLNGHERALAQSRTRSVEQLIRFLDTNQYQNILVLTENKVPSQKLESAFYALWSASNQQGFYQHQSVENTVGEAIEISNNIKRSKERRGWLQKVVGFDLIFQPRVRKDFDVVISFLSERNAIQVAPILDFYRRTDVPHVWFPIQTPQARFLKANYSSWHNSYAVLPTYLQDALQKEVSQTNSVEKTGLFYALGQVAVEIVNNSAISDGLELYAETPFGAIRSDSAGQFHLLPMVYWMDQSDAK